MYHQYQGWDDNRSHDLKTATFLIQRSRYQAHSLNPFAMCLLYLTTTSDPPLIMVARFESLWVSYWQGGGMALEVGSTATVSGTSYTSCSADVVSGCTWGPPTAYSQTMSLMSKSGLWLPTPAHTPRSSPLLHSPTHPTPTHGMWLYVLTLCICW